MRYIILNEENKVLKKIKGDTELREFILNYISNNTAYSKLLDLFIYLEDMVYTSELISILESDYGYTVKSDLNRYRPFKSKEDE